MKVPFGNLKKQYLAQKNHIDRAIGRVLKSGWFILGEEVTAFEVEFSKFCGTKYAVGVANGMEALELALKALGVRPGDEVITTPLSAAATALAIVRVGGRPIYCDVEENSLNLDPTKIQKLISKKTKVILPVHLYGRPANMSAIMKIAKKNKLFILEDAAQAHGAMVNDKPVSSYGDVTAFSFYPSKNLGAYGDGGAIVTDQKKIADFCRMLRNYGEKLRYEHVLPGYNSRLDELQAAILRARLKFLAEQNAKRHSLARLYSRLLTGLPIVTPEDTKIYNSVWHLYVIRVQARTRDKLRNYLSRQGVGTQVHYPKVLYRQTALLEKKATCPIAEQAVKEILSLPIYPEMKEAEVKYVCRQIRNFFQQESHGR